MKRSARAASFSHGLAVALAVTRNLKSNHGQTVAEHFIFPTCAAHSHLTILALFFQTTLP